MNEVRFFLSVFSQLLEIHRLAKRHFAVKRPSMMEVACLEA
jgi:hypothetical protein